MKQVSFLVLLLLFISIIPNNSWSQDRTVTLSVDMFNDQQVIFLSGLDGWVFKPGNDGDWADPDLNTVDWEELKPASLTFYRIDESGTFEGWFRMKFELDSTFTDIPLAWRSGTFGAMEVYVDGELVQSYGRPDSDSALQKNYNPYNKLPKRANLEIGSEYLLAIYLADHHSSILNKYTLREVRLDPWLRLAGPEYTEFIQSTSRSFNVFQSIWLTALTLLTFLFWVISFQAKKENLLRLIAWLNTALLISCIANVLSTSESAGLALHFFELLFTIAIYLGLGLTPIVFAQILKGEMPKNLKVLFWVFLFSAFLDYGIGHYAISAIFILIVITISTYYILKFRSRITPSQWMVVSGLFSTIFWILSFILIQIFLPSPSIVVQNIIVTFTYLSLPVSLLLFISVRYKETMAAIQKNAKEIVQLTNEKLEAEKEKQKAAENQKEILEKEVKARTQELRESLEHLRAAQEQLVQQEKLASLGQLTAGIAHEIKNPLNFVNNFSEVSLELIEEARDEVKNNLTSSPGRGDGGEGEQGSESGLILEILDDIEANLRKIHEHGSRADNIVRSMLLHSRGGSGEMEPADLNSLIKEYVNLAFHGMRAGKEPINVDIELNLDESIGKIPLITEDFSRVILNICNNAFDAMREMALSPPFGHPSTSGRGVGAEGEYSPKLTVRTISENEKVIIEIQDNGPGIPKEIQDKILQPFFTTKKGTQGTGLGLSITNDIVKAHGGELSLVSNPQVGTTFRIAFPNN